MRPKRADVPILGSAAGGGTRVASNIQATVGPATRLPRERAGAGDDVLPPDRYCRPLGWPGLSPQGEVARPLDWVFGHPE